mgnify:CR=1 FL=1
MFEAQRLAAPLSRVADADPARWLSVEEVFRAATEGSAAILGFDHIGRLEPGYRADIVFLDIGHINYVPLRNPLRQLVLAENGAAIHSVMIDGRFVLREGRMLTLDEARLRRQVEAAVERLDAANAGGCAALPSHSAISSGISAWRTPARHSISIAVCLTPIETWLRE